MNRILFLLFIFCISLTSATYYSFKKLPDDLRLLSGAEKKPQVLDRSGKALSVTFENEFNLHSQRELAEIPEFLKLAFILSEDKRFYSHTGVDWLARANAVLQTVSKAKIDRGASTITEQVVRMINPRRRTIWSRWIEGFEAHKLEKRISKNEIYNFYLNQVPFAARRRGVVQAAQYYFNRSLDTLSLKEFLALVVFVRAPNALKINSPYLESSINSLAKRLFEQKTISESQFELIKNDKISIAESKIDIDASQFVQYAIKNSKKTKFLKTSLDSSLQIKAQELLEERLRALKNKNVNNAAVLVVENDSAAITTWVNSKSNGFHDAIRIKRQAGSTLKPFLYALALKKGWNGATVIEDAPIDQAVGVGLHAYKNYSRTFYGPLRLRLALGNSLNSTAIRTIAFVGGENFLNTLRSLDFKGLNKSTEFYGDGLALGNAEVSLYELVQAYRALANKGEFNNLNFDFQRGSARKIFDQKTTSLIADILSDSQARALEFSAGGVLSMPVQTAVKTGTSNDFKDAWAIGFSSTHTVGIWMGNLNRESMREISGAQGPAYVLRSIFAEINRFTTAKSLYLSPELISKEVCSVTGKLAVKSCNRVTEWFEKLPTEVCTGHVHEKEVNTKIYIKYPTPNLNLALDPRIPDQQEAFEFEVATLGNVKQIAWNLDGEIIANSKGNSYLWNLKRGKHQLFAIVYLEGNKTIKTSTVKFAVR